MKLSKLLLGAIVAGITIPAASSCNKKEYHILPVREAKAKASTPEANNTPEVINVPENCPACGMG